MKEWAGRNSGIFSPSSFFSFFFFLGLHGGGTKTKTKVTIEVHGLYIVVVELLVRVSEG